MQCIDSSDVHIVLDLDLHNHFTVPTGVANNAQRAGAGGRVGAGAGAGVGAGAGGGVDASAGGGEAVGASDGLSSRSGYQAHASAAASSDTGEHAAASAVRLSAATTQGEELALRASSAASTGHRVSSQGRSRARGVFPWQGSRERQRPSQKRSRESAAAAAGGFKRAPKKGRVLTDGHVVLDASARTALPDASPSAAQKIGELQAQVYALQARLRHETKHRHAAALQSVCSGVNLQELNAILGRASMTNFTPRAPKWHGIELTVFGIKHVHDTASKVLAASSCTPAGILRSMLLKVAEPEGELSHVVLSRVVDYIHQESTHEWTAEQLTHLRSASALAAVLTNESIGAWRFQQGELTLECMQVWPVVRSALADVFKTLHGYGVLLFGRTYLALTACSTH